jgi:hypothetical protein
MSASAPTLSDVDETASVPTWERALLDRQLASLDRLAEMGMAIAGAITQRATADEPVPDAILHHASIDFARAARAVRLTFALQSRLIADFKKPPAARAADNDEDIDGVDVRWLDEPTPEEEDEAQRRRARQVVRRMAEGAGQDGETVERLVTEAAERLERDDIYADIATRSFGETIAAICRDLEIEPDWSLFPDEDWARERMPGGPATDPHFWIRRRLGRHWRPDTPDEPPHAASP